ncbi:translocon-associated protein subunit alpha [Acrasis kona]|uniref:Translocon-associated protein subunit alpha n=1 Tax=Acrasis kona TaxID=1008807 RepID=A0AAW2YU01_9EUKA
MKISSILALFAVLACIVLVRAQDDDILNENADSLSGFISSPDVGVYSFLPSIHDNTIEVGKSADVLMGFTNNGDRPFNVQYIRGYLVSPVDPTHILYNFTGTPVNVTVEAEEVATLLYRFKTNPQMDAREFGVVVDVFYLNEDRDTFATTFFNRTLNFTEASEGIDAKNIFSYLFLFIMLGLLGFGAFKLASQTQSYKKYFGAPKKVTSTVTTTSVSNNILRTGPLESQQIDLDYVPAAHRKLLEKRTKRVDSLSAKQE